MTRELSDFQRSIKALVEAELKKEQFDLDEILETLTEAAAETAALVDPISYDMSAYNAQRIWVGCEPTMEQVEAWDRGHNDAMPTPEASPRNTAAN
jgi:hypothetical protein